MPKYKSKIETVEAHCYTRIGLQAENVADWCGGEQTLGGLEIKTPGGTKLAMYGDMIIKDSNGDFFIWDEAKFKEIYKEI